MSDTRGINGKRHRFLDETGDPTFYGSGRKLILGEEGVSRSFGIGLVRIDQPLDEVRRRIKTLEREVESDPLLKTIPSVQKRILSGGFFFHACKDSPEVRAVLLRFIRGLPCESEIVIARKNPVVFEQVHHGREEEFYADLLAHLIERQLGSTGTLVLNVAERGSATRDKVLTSALQIAAKRATLRRSENLQTGVVFNVQSPRTEPLLTVSDYLCWSVQSETRFYDYLIQKISLVIELDGPNWPAGRQDFHDRNNPLTAGNKIGPPVT